MDSATLIQSVAAGIVRPSLPIHPSVPRTLKRKQYEQRTEEWYDVRKGLITASDAGGALNIPAFKGQRHPRQDCLKQKTTGSFTGNHMTRHGQLYEDDVRERAMNALGECAWEVGLLLHDKYPWLGASPDGITSSGKLIEIKCPYKRKPIPNHVPDVYYAQIQIQLEVTDLDQCLFVQWQPEWLAPDGEEAFCIVVVERDRRWFADRVTLLREFHQELMALRAAYVPPPPPTCLIDSVLYDNDPVSSSSESPVSSESSKKSDESVECQDTTGHLGVYPDKGSSEYVQWTVNWS